MKLFGRGQITKVEKTPLEISPQNSVPETRAVSEGRREELSRVELFFLSKFAKPLNPETVGEYLKATIQRDPTKTATQFLRSSLIESASGLIGLLASTTQVDLKQALKDEGLKVSGKKEELAKGRVPAGGVGGR